MESGEIIDLSETPQMHYADYIVFAGFLLITMAIGIIIGVINRRKATTKEFLQAGSDMHYFPVAMSMQASFLSSIFIVSVPCESYNFGIPYAYIILSYWIAFPLIGHVILPVFFKLNITSAYEYLEIRFNKAVRLAGAITFIIEMILYVSVVIYTPALTMTTVTPLPTYACILLVSGVCIVYTVVGGMRATIWNDTIQMIVIIGSLAMLIGMGHKKTGSPYEVYQIARNGSRLDFNAFNPDPRIRTTFWTQLVGCVFLNLAMYGASQTIIQKALSTKSLVEAQKSLYVLCATATITMALVMWLGIVAYAYNADCDPQAAGYVSKPDQIIPRFMMDVMGHLHGLPGLFIAAAFSGALSSVSGCLNAMAAVFLVDFVVPGYKHQTGRVISEKSQAVISRILALCLGLVVTALSFAAPGLGSIILQIALSIFGMVGGPLTGVVAAGILMPCVNPWGALTGLIVSLVITLWVGVGTMLNGPPLPFLPHRTDGCPRANYTANITTASFSLPTDWTTGMPEPEESYFGFYKLSYTYYGLIAIGIVMLVSVIISGMSGVMKGVPHRHIFPCADTCCKHSTPRCRECSRCHSLPEEDENAIMITGGDDVVHGEKGDGGEFSQVQFKNYNRVDIPGTDLSVRSLRYISLNPAENRNRESPLYTQDIKEQFTEGEKKYSYINGESKNPDNFPSSNTRNRTEHAPVEAPTNQLTRSDDSGIVLTNGGSEVDSAFGDIENGGSKTQGFDNYAFEEATVF